MSSSRRRRWAVVLFAGGAVALAVGASSLLRRPARGAPPVEKVATCYECHEPVKRLHAGSKHRTVGCTRCHQVPAGHSADPGPATRPLTDTSWDACGRCHRAQVESASRVSYGRPARDEKSLLTGRSPNPYWDKLMDGHGFTKEHNATRSHGLMLVDHLVVDRAYGGRFQPKDGWQYVLRRGRAWDILVDTAPSSTEHKPLRPQTAAAANATCLQCKSQDHILSWPYMGEPNKAARFSRLTSPVVVAKTLQHAINCFYCHDPHSARPRIVRDALIEALTRKEKDTLWHRDPKRTGLKVLEMGVRGFPRKIALLDKYDTRLQCGQCHVEYNCNPGTDVRTGKKVGFADRRTNHFPYKDVFGLYAHYVKQIGFLDFKHAQTGGLLWKAQHPEAETHYNSRHARAGVGCDGCHLPKRKDPRSGKTITSHFAVTPRVQLKETCLRCHDQWSEEQARYTIDSVKTHIRGKMRKAEHWLAVLIDRIVEARRAGVPEQTLARARDQHLKAHILWEFWTAENSDGFHNPELARESLTRSVDESLKGISLLEAVKKRGK